MKARANLPGNRMAVGKKANAIIKKQPLETKRTEKPLNRSPYDSAASASALVGSAVLSLVVVVVAEEDFDPPK